MGWFKNLKGWQKNGVILGCLHIVFYAIGMILFGATAGYFIVILEFPWAFILKLIGFQGDLIFFPYDLIIGTCFYSFIGVVGGQIFNVSNSPKLP